MTTIEDVMTGAAPMPPCQDYSVGRPALQVCDAFTGIAGFREGFRKAGMRTVSMIEWEKNARSVLAHHYPDTPLLEDIKDVRGTDLGRIDVMAGGFPCQDTSIAAPHRAGLAGTRSSHFNDFVRLLGEYAELVDATGPRWAIIENPSGLLTSNGGRDMDAVRWHLVQLGYGWAYRVVDGGYGSTPQRRPRVVVVAHRGGDPRPAWQVLGDRLPGSEAPREDHGGGQDTGPAAGRDAGDADFRVWRKGARPRVALAKGYEGGYRETWVDDGRANTLTGYDGGLATRQTHLIRQHGSLRTLTLREWERLMGFPDDWTAMVKSDSARYTALGNAMHVGTAAWLGQRLAQVHYALPMLDTLRSAA